MLMAMMTESQRSVAALTGVVNQLRRDYSALSNQGPTQTLSGAVEHLSGLQLPPAPVDYTAAFTDQEADRDDAILLATIQAMQKGTPILTPALLVPVTSIAVGQGIADARVQM